MTVVAKMQCQTIETMDWGKHTPKAVKVNLSVIYGREGENKAFTDATPSGGCWLSIKEGFPASEFFKPGKKYYVHFTEADE